MCNVLSVNSFAFSFLFDAKIIILWRGSPNIEMDEHSFMVNRERAVDYLNSLDKVISHISTYFMQNESL
jgi:hypothetical protein